MEISHAAFQGFFQDPECQPAFSKARGFMAWHHALRAAGAGADPSAAGSQDARNHPLAV